MATITFGATPGNWSDDTKWVGGVKPTASDDALLTVASANCTIDAASVCKSLTCTGYTGILTHNAFTLTISGSLTLVSGMTYTPLATSTLSFNATGTLTTGGKLIPLMTVTAGTLTLGDNLSFMASKVITVTLSSGATINLNGKTLSGNSATNRILLQSSSIGIGRTITIASGTFANADFMDITFSSASSLDLSAITGLSGDCGGNTLTGGGSVLTFTPSATQTWNGTSGGNWSANAWSGRVPLPQDDVVINAAFSASQTVTADMPRLGRSIDWTGATGTPAWVSAAVLNYIFGSLTLISGMTITHGNTTTFAGRGTYSIASAGKDFAGSAITIFAPGGTYS